MLSASLLSTSPGALTWGGDLLAAGPPQPQSQQSSSLTRQLRSASAAFVAAASVSCDVEPISASVLAAAEGALTTKMGCSPPSTRPRIMHHTRSLTVPTAALASSKTRRKRRGGGAGGGGGDDDFYDDFFGGGGGDFNGGEGGGDDGGEGDAGSSDDRGRWLQDVLLLWSVFCAWSTWNVLQHVTKQCKPSVAAVV